MWPDLTVLPDEITFNTLNEDKPMPMLLNPFAQLDIRTHSFRRRLRDTFGTMAGVNTELWGRFGNNYKLGIFDYLALPSLISGAGLYFALPLMWRSSRDLFNDGLRLFRSRNPALWPLALLAWIVGVSLITVVGGLCAIAGTALLGAGSVLKLATYALSALLTLLFTPVVAVVHAFLKGHQPPPAPGGPGPHGPLPVPVHAAVLAHDWRADVNILEAALQQEGVHVPAPLRGLLIAALFEDNLPLHEREAVVRIADIVRRGARATLRPEEREAWDRIVIGIRMILLAWMAAPDAFIAAAGAPPAAPPIGGAPVADVRALLQRVQRDRQPRRDAAGRIFTERLDAINEIRRQQHLEAIDAPHDLRCPVSVGIMDDPVRVSSGRVYDRRSLIQLFETGGGIRPAYAPSIPCPATRAREIAYIECNLGTDQASIRQN